MTKKELASFLYHGAGVERTIYKVGKSWETSPAQPMRENFDTEYFFGIPAVDFKSRKEAYDFLTEVEDGWSMR